MVAEIVLMRNSVIALAAAAIVSGCASGSSLVTGTVRPPVQAAAVKIYLDPPKEYETIGLVRGSSSSGFTQQGDFDYAVNEIKRRAGKMGANGVLLSSTGAKSSVAIVNGHVGYSESQLVEGRAIFVKAEK